MNNDELEAALDEAVERGWVERVGVDETGRALYRMTPQGDHYVEAMGRAPWFVAPELPAKPQTPELLADGAWRWLTTSENEHQAVVGLGLAMLAVDARLEGITELLGLGDTLDGPAIVEP